MRHVCNMAQAGVLSVQQLSREVSPSNTSVTSTHIVQFASALVPNSLRVDLRERVLSRVQEVIEGIMPSDEVVALPRCHTTNSF